MKIIFFGTPAFSVEILKHLLESHVDVVAVVTKPDKPQGRSQKLKPPAVKQFLIDQNISIPLFQPEKISTPEWEKKLKDFDADLFVVVAFGEIVKQNILDLPRLDCINIHASLLPKYRGAAPIHRAIINGEKFSGVTIMEMVKALDAGDMIHVEKVAIDEDMNVADLEKKLVEAGKFAIIKVIKQFETGTVKKIPQVDSDSTYAHKMSSLECKIDFNKSSVEVHNLIRGSTPFPGAWCEIVSQNQTKRLKVKKSEILPSFKGSPGSIIKFEKDSFIVATRDNSVALLEVQLEGKKAISAKEFILGSSKPDCLNP